MKTLEEKLRDCTYQSDDFWCEWSGLSCSASKKYGKCIEMTEYFKNQMREEANPYHARARRRNGNS